MVAAEPSHFVFVDFENVPNVDLASIAGKPVMVTLLIGKGQKKLDLPLVQQIHRYHNQVQIVEVGASGRNALDLTLAYSLGRAVQQHPAAHFYIVSKDKDFNPLIAHLEAKVQACRCDAFAALPFLPQPKKTTSDERKIESAVDSLAKLITHLQTKTKARPTRRKTLQTHINNVLGKVLSEAEHNEAIGELISRGIIKIDEHGKVSY